MRRPVDYIFVFGKGLCVGALEAVHGVSSSTVGLILGVYHELVDSLRAMDRESVRLLRAGRFRSFWKKVNGGFFLSLMAGIIVSISFLTQFIAYFLERHFISTTSLLFGLILISAIIVLRNIRKWTFFAVLMFFAGFAINFFLTLASPVATPDHLFIVFLTGIVAGFTLMIPGLTGAFVLILLGKYQLVINAFNEVDIAVLAIFFLGNLIGLWMASRFIHRLLADYYSTSVALLAGLMVGALNKLWPWRSVLEYVTNGKGIQIPAYDKSILPWDYMALTNKDPQVFQAILMMAVGVFIVVLVEKVTAGLKTKF